MKQSLDGSWQATPCITKFLSWCNSNYEISGCQNHLQTNSSLPISICQSQFKRHVSIWDTLYVTQIWCIHFHNVLRLLCKLEKNCKWKENSMHTVRKWFSCQEEINYEFLLPDISPSHSGLVTCTDLNTLHSYVQCPPAVGQQSFQQTSFQTSQKGWNSI